MRKTFNPDGTVTEEPEFTPETPDPAEVLAAERASMECSPFQGRVTLGSVEVARFEAILADDTVFVGLGLTTEQTWVLREAVNETIVWRRNSQAMGTFAFLMGYTPEQMDDLFRAAALMDGKQSQQPARRSQSPQRAMT